LLTNSKTLLQRRRKGITHNLASAKKLFITYQAKKRFALTKKTISSKSFNSFFSKEMQITFAFLPLLAYLVKLLWFPLPFVKNG
jgi:cellulose synthase/poly-beta-1,6-N-acetylglucosamine synthase-like glycosyltransferase